MRPRALKRSARRSSKPEGGNHVRVLVSIAAAIVGFGIVNVVEAADGAELVVKESAADFATTVERVEAEIEERGANIVATVDHHPQLGTPLLQGQQTAGLDLPLRVLVWEDESGNVQIGYWPPSRIASPPRH